MSSRYAAIVLPGATRAVLEAAAEVALTFGPRCALDVEQATVVLDVSGCAHLKGGEEKLAKELMTALKKLTSLSPEGGEGRGEGPGAEVEPAPTFGRHPRNIKPDLGERRARTKPVLDVRLAIADGPIVASTVARGCVGICLVPTGTGRKALAPLPIEVLGYDEKTVLWFQGLGVYTVGEVQALPAAELERRLGAAGRASLRLIHGDDTEPIDWYQPPVVVEAGHELEHGVEALEPFIFVLKSLVDPLCARLEARGQLLARAELWVKYEKLPGLTTREQTWEAVFPSPLRDGKAVLSVLRLRLEAVALKAPVREVKLRYVHTVERLPQALHLWTKEAAAARALPALIAELTAELGPERVGCLVVRDRHAASARSVLLGVGAESQRPVSPWVGLTYASSEPLRCAPKPEVWEGATSGRLLVRRQGLEWWRRGFSEAWDSLAVWVPSLCATAWVDQRLGEGFGPSAWFRGWLEG